MTIFIIDIEAVDTRYTKQWKKHLPEQLKKYFPDQKITTISGGEMPQNTTPGAFLNFAGTNIYKSNQLEKIANLFNQDKINDGDYFLYTDAWNPTVIQLKYMAELLGKKIKIGGMWHAGSYDPADFLGRLIGNAPWVRLAEESMFNVYDQNFFATKFHIDIFRKSFPNVDVSKIIQVGWPMEYMSDELTPFSDTHKENIILFPHRIAPEKQVDVFKDMANEMPQFKWIICQEKKLSKNEYHKLLAKSKIVFSANLQETLGISAYEGAILGALPIVPDRLSYSEMYLDEFKYPSVWTTDYKNQRTKMIDHIRYVMDNYDSISNNIPPLLEKLDQFFNGEELYRAIGSVK